MPIPLSDLLEEEPDTKATIPLTRLLAEEPESGLLGLVRRAFREPAEPAEEESEARSEPILFRPAGTKRATVGLNPPQVVPTPALPGIPSQAEVMATQPGQLVPEATAATVPQETPETLAQAQAAPPIEAARLLTGNPPELIRGL